MNHKQSHEPMKTKTRPAIILISLFFLTLPVLASRMPEGYSGEVTRVDAGVALVSRPSLRSQFHREGASQPLIQRFPFCFGLIDEQNFSTDAFRQLLGLFSIEVFLAETNEAVFVWTEVGNRF
jgi:hypothetical protein